MKILELAPYVFSRDLPEFQRNQTGFGIVVWDICRALAAKGNNVNLFTMTPARARDIGGVQVLEHGITQNFASFFASDPVNSLKIFFRLQCSLIRKLKIIRHFSCYSLVKQMIALTRPDIIHIHEIGLSSEPFIKAAYFSGIPFVVTCHGISLIDENCGLCGWEKKKMMDILSFLDDKEIPVTCISFGTRKGILDLLGKKESEKIVTIPNGIDLSVFKFDPKINKERKIVVAGSFTKSKNQIFLLKSLLTLRSQTDGDIHCVLLGEGSERANLERFIKENQIENVRMPGMCPREELPEHYKTAWMTALVSTSEGFGIPIIESYACGTPVITFSDLDAVEDTFHKDAMITVEERDPVFFSKKLIESLNRNWDAEKISRIAQKWDLGIIAEKYVNFFQQIIDENKRSSVDAKK